MTTIKGTDQLHNRLVALQKAGKPIMGLLAVAAVREQKLLVRVRTGNLRRTIHYENLGARSVDTVASAPYAADVEFGTRPHIIRPRNKKALRFAPGAGSTLSGRPRAGAAVVFAKVVRHPGTKPYPFMVPGAAKALATANIKGVIVRAWNSGA